MANTYTTKLGLAKPAHGDVDWHIPINGNWDKIDTELDKALKISGTTIDADKNWNGKSITNMKSLTLTSAAHAALTIIYPSNNIIASSDAIHTFSGADWVVAKTATIAHNGTLRIQHTHCATGGGSAQSIDSRICCDGEVRATYHSTRDQGAKTYVTDVIVRAGSVVTIEGNCYAGYISGVKFMGSAGVIPLGTVPLTITVTQD
jgi:hypothetical protein